MTKQDVLKRFLGIDTLLRFAMGFIFLWSFLDKLFGLGYATPVNKSWLSGNSPTSGFLANGTHGPFSKIFQSLAGNPLIDWLFMLGLLCVGIALILNLYTKLAAYAGTAMMLLIYLAAFPPEHNPLIDEHIIYSLVLLGIMVKSQSKKLIS